MLFLEKGVYRYAQEGRLQKLGLTKEQISEGRNNGFQAHEGLSKKKLNKLLWPCHMLKFQ